MKLNFSKLFSALSSFWGNFIYVNKSALTYDVIAEADVKVMNLREDIHVQWNQIHFINRSTLGRNEIRLQSDQQSDKRTWWSSQSSSRVLITIIKIYSQFLFTLSTPFLHFLHEIAPQTEAHIITVLKRQFFFYASLSS